MPWVVAGIPRPNRRNKVSFISRLLGMFRLIHFPPFSPLAGPAHNVLLNACTAQQEEGEGGEREKKQRNLFRNSRNEGNTFTATLHSLRFFADRGHIFSSFTNRAVRCHESSSEPRRDPYGSVLHNMKFFGNIFRNIIAANKSHQNCGSTQP